MVITTLVGFSARDVPGYMWERLSRFSNVNHTAAVIQDLHRLTAAQQANARKQAEQIRYCLLQAREFYEAAQSVSLATRPTLLYYSAMSLALAEVLLKQTAESRLSKLRANHGSHGLVMALAAEPKPTDPVVSATKMLVAKQQVGANGRTGTFEVWRRSAREYSLGGYQTEFHGNAQTSSFRISMVAEDREFGYLPDPGISLYECLVNLPSMIESLRSLQVRTELARGTISHEVRGGETKQILVVHPAHPDVLQKFGDACVAEPRFVNDVHVTELPSGYILKWKAPGSGRFSLPPGTNLNTNDVYFSTSRTAMNEFGYLYIALHLMGNFARYYPDIWVRHLEQNSDLALATSGLCSGAMQRMPLLAASELSRSFFIETEPRHAAV